MSSTRCARLKAVFDGRCLQLQLVKDRNTGILIRKQNHAYAQAVANYVRTRRAWRAFRGWPY